MTPTRLPEDGVLVLCNPDFTTLPVSSGIRLAGVGSTANPAGAALVENAKHPLLNRIDASAITVSKFTKFTLSADFETLLSHADVPMLSVKDVESSKVVLMSFSLHYSNLPILLEFPMLVKNTFDYFFPATVSGNAFSVGEKVEVNSMGQKLSISGYNYEETLEQILFLVNSEINLAYSNLRSKSVKYK